MKQKNTWVLLLTLAAVITVLFLLVNPPDLGPDEELAEPGVFAHLDLDQISRVVVNSTRTNSTLIRQGDQWVVQEFDNFPADQSALEEAISALRQLDLGDVVSSNREKQATFQVDQSGIEILLHGMAGEENVLAHFYLGKPGHDYRRIYFRLADSDQVHEVDQQLRGRFDRGARTWRNRRPFTFTPEDVSALRLDAGEGGEQMSLQLDDQGNWIIEGEEDITADTAKVELVARSFGQLAADDFPEEQDAGLASYGLDDPLYSYSVDLLDGSTLSLLVGSVEADENRFYVKRDDSPIIYILGKFRIRNLSKTLDELRLQPAVTPPGGEE